MAVGRAIRSTRVTLLVAVAVHAACGSNAGSVAGSSGPSRGAAAPTGTLVPQSIAIPTDAAGKPVTIVWMGDHYYSPSKLTVALGTTVMWWMLGMQEHDVWAYDGSFHSPTMGPGSTFTHTFTKLGSFRYFCVPHSGDGMYGEIVVVERLGG
jgi:plastocyanin